MKIKLHTGGVTLVTKEKGLQLIQQGLGVEYLGENPEEEEVKKALATPEKPTEKIEVIHHYIVGEEEE